MGRSDRLLSLPANDVERLVLDLPLGPVAGSKSDDGIGSDRQISDEVVAIRRFPLGVEDLDLEPVDFQGVLAITQRHVMQPAVAMHKTLLAAPDRMLDQR